jgi:hypothetical protein
MFARARSLKIETAARHVMLAMLAIIIAVGGFSTAVTAAEIVTPGSAHRAIAGGSIEATTVAPPSIKAGVARRALGASPHREQFGPTPAHPDHGRSRKAYVLAKWAGPQDGFLPGLIVDGYSARAPPES